jgi:hypothetical protein
LRRQVSRCTVRPVPSISLIDISLVPVLAVMHSDKTVINVKNVERCSRQKSWYLRHARLVVV